MTRARVLIVDDDPALRELCAANLRRDGFDVIQAENGLRGLERALADEPHLVLLDIRMPVLDGFGLAAALQLDERTRQLPVIFLSAERDLASRRHAEDLGALAFFDKPFDPTAVSDFITAVLSRLNPASRESDVVFAH